MSLLIAMLLLSGELSHYSFGFSSSIKQISAKDPFAKPDQITFDFFPSDQQKGPATTDDLSPPMLNSLFQGIENREICGDSKDNNKNGLVDENCSALPSSQQDSLGQLPPPNTLGQPSEPPQDDNNQNPESEICGDGEDNDGNGAVDENCNNQPSEPPQDDNNQNPESEICGDGQDNDGNGEVDENCNSPSPGQDDNNQNPETEICGDGQDNDGNGEVDENCNSQPPGQDDNNQNPETEICGDGQDNDGNGAVDENCNNQPSEPPQDDNNQNPETEICGDGEDNDGNGEVDENCSVDG